MKITAMAATAYRVVELPPPAVEVTTEVLVTVVVVVPPAAPEAVTVVVVVVVVVAPPGGATGVCSVRAMMSPGTEVPQVTRPEVIGRRTSS